MTELIVTLEDNASATIIRKAISLLKGVKKVVTVKRNSLSKLQTEQLNRLKDLSALKPNWDGEGALSISKSVLKNAKAVVNKTDDNTLSLWTFFPEVNGTILLQRNDNSACVSIGKNDFSAVSDNQVLSKRPFSVEDIISFIS